VSKQMNFHDPDGITCAKQSQWFNANAKAILKHITSDDRLVIELMPAGRATGAPLERFVPEHRPDLGRIVKALANNSSADVIEVNRQTMKRSPCRVVVSWDDFIAAEAIEQAKPAAPVSVPAPKPAPIDREVVHAFAAEIHAAAARVCEGVEKPGVLQLSQLNPHDDKLVICGRYEIGAVEEMAHDAIAAAEAGHNVYVEARLVGYHVKGNVRGKLEDTTAVFALVVDRDAYSGKAGVDFAEPTMRVETSPGSGHDWFFLTKAISGKDAQALGEALRRVVGADSATFKPTQPYRVAGTPNYPNAKKIANGRTVCRTHFTGRGPSYYTDQLQAIIAAVEPIVSAVEPTLSPFADERTGFSSARVEAILSGPVNPEMDRSGRFFAATCAAVEDGLTAADFEALCREHADGCASKFIDRGDLHEQIETCWRKAAPKVEAAPAQPASDATLNEDEEEAAAVDEPEPEAASIPNPIEPLTHVPGLVGDLVDWITATAKRPNRVLALGVAVTVIGTLIGRRVAGPTRSATHLYVLGLAPTGSGKQHPIDCLKVLMEGVKAADHLGPSEFISMPAVINFLQRKPLSVCAQDEFGAYLKRINGWKASGFEAGISKVLRELWGLSFARYDTPEWAGRAFAAIKSPALSLYGLSTPEEFFEALQASDLSNGFLNRFLLLSTETRAPETTPSIDRHKVPDEIVQAMRILYYWREGDLAAANLNNPNLNPEPDVRPWTSSAAEAAYREFSSSIEQRIDLEPGLKHFIGRSAEMAVRLATIRAAARWVGNYDFTVDLTDIRWGIELASASGHLLATEARERMTGDGMTHGQIVNKVIETVKGHPRISRTALLRALQKSVRSAQLEEILRMLIESGTIAKELIAGAKGPAAAWYRFLR
jgi:hypothetical protein